MANLTEFAINTLYPRIEEDGVPVLFPDMDFQKTGRKWNSHKRMDGTEPSKHRKDKTAIFPRNDRLYIIENDERKGTSKDLITYFKELHSLNSNGEAIAKMAEALNLTPPESNSPIDRERRMEQEALSQFLRGTQEALYREEGKAVLDYLKKERGYSDDLIKYAKFGYISEAEASVLKEVYRRKKGASTWSPSIGKEHVLIFPYEYGCNITGFIIRSIKSDGDRYRSMFLQEETKIRMLFGLTQRKLTGDGKMDKNLIITEGEIDCLRAQHAGIPNIVACSGIHEKGISREAVKTAKKAKGIEKVTLLFDTDKDPASTRKALEASIRNIIAEGLKPFICKLPQRVAEVNGEKIFLKEDIDTYLHDHSAEQLFALLEDSESGFMYMYRNLWKDAEEWTKNRENKILSDKETDDFMERLSYIVTSPLILPNDRNYIMKRTEEVWGITDGSLQEYMERRQEALDAERQKTDMTSVLSDAGELLKAGKMDDLFSLLEKRVPETKRMSREAKYGHLLRATTTEERKGAWKQMPDGIPVQYSFKSARGEEEQLILPAGALTYIGALTSHGKSRMLENLALQIAQNGETGSVLYFSFEESKNAVEQQFLNIFADMYLSDGNLRTIRSYYKENGFKFKRGVSIADFEKKEKQFHQFMDSQRLRVFFEDYDCTELIEAIKYMARQIKVQAVFIDYIQLLHLRGTRLQRKDELQEICRRLMNMAIELRLPVIVATQLNRQTLSPIEMQVQNISEASDIEHSANMIILLWNTASKPSAQSKYGEDKEGKRLEPLLHLGTGGRIYAQIAKNRGGERNMEAILDFDGNRGVIRGNYVEKRPEPEQTELSIPDEVKPPVSDDDLPF